MVELVYDDVTSKMQAAVDHLKKDFSGVRTGRASTALLEGITVDYYGAPTPLNQLATLSVPENTLITVQPWDSSILSSVEKAIQASDLGLTPSNDGHIIRLPVPRLSGERRQELAKLVKKMAEDAKVAIRNIRRHGNDELKNFEKSGDISEDDHRKAHDKVQKITDDYTKKIDEILSIKEKEILEI